MHHIDMGVRQPMGSHDPQRGAGNWHSGWQEQADGPGAACNSDVTNNFPRVNRRSRLGLTGRPVYTRTTKTTYPDPFGSPARVHLISFGSQKLGAILTPLQDFTELSESMAVPHWQSTPRQ